jgi:acid phosphatase
LEHVKKRGEIAGDFRKICGLAEDAPDRLAFLRQPRTAPASADKVERKVEKDRAKRRFWGT